MTFIGGLSLLILFAVTVFFVMTSILVVGLSICALTDNKKSVRTKAIISLVLVGVSGMCYMLALGPMDLFQTMYAIADRIHDEHPRIWLWFLCGFGMQIIAAIMNWNAVERAGILWAPLRALLGPLFPVWRWWNK